MTAIIVVFTALLGLAQALPAEAASHEKKVVHKHALPESATAEAIRALDTDHSGKVEKAEVEAFASSQGLSADEVRAEFADLDTNHDGELEADEITNTLNSASTSEAAKASDVAKRSEVETKSLASELEPKHVAVEVERKHSSRATAASMAADVSTALPTTILTAATATAKRTAPDSASSSVPSNKNQLQLQALELDAQQHAGKALAEVFARTAARALEARGQDNEKATKLEQAAKALRSQTADLKQRAAAETVNAATAAAATVLREASDKVKTLEEQAVEAETQATKKRAEAKEAMNRALSARSEMSNKPILLELAQRKL